MISRIPIFKSDEPFLRDLVTPNDQALVVGLANIKASTWFRGQGATVMPRFDLEMLYKADPGAADLDVRWFTEKCVDYDPNGGLQAPPSIRQGPYSPTGLLTWPRVQSNDFSAGVRNHQDLENRILLPNDVPKFIENIDLNAFWCRLQVFINNGLLPANSVLAIWALVKGQDNDKQIADSAIPFDYNITPPAQE
jgi:hypothetical protein